MDSTRDSTSKSEAIDAAAADWLLAHDRGLTPAEEMEFGRWVSEDARHVAAWREAQSAWARLDQMGELSEEALSSDSEWAVVPSVVSAPVQGSKFALGWKKVLPWAAAITLAVGPSIWWWHSKEDRVAPVAFTQTRASVVTLSPHEISLPDGSQVQLNADSEIEEMFTVGERHVRLVRGEAYFTVAKDSTRPFVVDASGVTVRAVGTAFNVRLSAASVEVLVTEGTVRVLEGRAGAVIPRPTEDIGSDSSFLDAGRRATIPLGNAVEMSPEIAEVTDDEVQATLAWQVVRLQFADLPLEGVAAAFNQLNSTRLVVDPSARDTIVAGTFRADNVVVFVDFMERAFGLTADRREDGTIRLSRADR
jgi:transmembrane sensor